MRRISAAELIARYGFSDLSDRFRRFFKVMVCFNIFTQINGIFINTFIQKATGGTAAVMRYNLMLALVQPLAMVASSAMLCRISPLKIQRIGLGMYALVYGILLANMEAAARGILVLAGLLSAAAGFFYTTYIIQLIFYTEDGNRDRAMGVMGSAGGFISLITPLLSGALVSAFSGFTGYHILFWLGLATVGIGLYFSFQLAPIPKDNREGAINFLRLARILVCEPAPCAAMLTSMISGMYAGTMSFFLSMLLYQLEQSEALVGNLNFMGGVAATFAAMIYTRHVKPDNRVRIMVLMVSALFFITALLYLRLNAAMIIGYNLALSFSAPFFSNPPLVLYMGIIQTLPMLHFCSARVHALREFFYTAGRVAGIVLAMVLPQTTVGAVTVMIAVVGAQWMAALLCRGMRKEVASRQGDSAQRRL